MEKKFRDAGPPGAWRSAHRMVNNIRSPIESFLHIEAASGLLLLAAAVVALVWANSPWAHSYHELWAYEFGFQIAGFKMSHDLHWWINDGLMAIFFFVVGLEIKREIIEGELATLRRASLPIAAAIGGMVVPALIFVGFNAGGPAMEGWGIPMATDIAFAVGVLSLVGNRVPPALRVLLLALAIIDDIGAILVIAVFYSGGLNFAYLWLIGGSLVVLFLMRLVGVRQVAPYFIPGAALWFGVHEFGVHATIAGVVLGLLTPHTSWFGKEGFLAIADSATTDFKKIAQEGGKDDDLLRPLARLSLAQREALSPIVRLQNGLHGYVAFFIMPVFALANAGVALGGLDLSDSVVFNVSAGVALGLLLGKPVGVMLASWIAVRLGLSSLPTGVRWPGIFAVGAVAGIGFTMAIFIAGLAYPGVGDVESVYHPASKMAVLVGSGLAAVLGLLIARFTLPLRLEPGAAATEREAESRTGV